MIVVPGLMMFNASAFLNPKRMRLSTYQFIDSELHVGEPIGITCIDLPLML